MRRVYRGTGIDVSFDLDRCIHVGECLLTATTTVEPMRNGPLRITGEIHVRLDDGTEEILPRATLCRCGESARKPFCDNTHLKNGFTAPGEPFRIRLSAVRPRLTQPIEPSADPRGAT